MSVDADRIVNLCNSAHDMWRFSFSQLLYCIRNQGHAFAIYFLDISRSSLLRIGRPFPFELKRNCEAKTKFLMKELSNWWFHNLKWFHILDYIIHAIRQYTWNNASKHLFINLVRNCKWYLFILFLLFNCNSLPFQIGVALYLLYRQVKFAFVSGVAITILLIPGMLMYPLIVFSLTYRLFGLGYCCTLKKQLLSLKEVYYIWYW